jgi:hypothetical protein
MRTILLSLLFCHLFNCTLCQELPNGDNDGSTLVGYKFSTGSMFNHEVRVEHFLTSRWSLIYSAGYSVSQTGNTSDYRTPLGATVGIGLLTALSCGGNAGDGFLLCCLIPDGVAVHFPFDKGFDFSPYVNLSGLNFRQDKVNGNSFIYSPSVGFRLMKYCGKSLVISAEQSFTRSIDNSILGSSGISISGRF